MKQLKPTEGVTKMSVKGDFGHRTMVGTFEPIVAD